MSEPKQCIPFSPSTVILVVSDGDPETVINHVKAGISLADTYYVAAAAAIDTGGLFVSLSEQEQLDMMDAPVKSVVKYLSDRSQK